MSIDSVNDRQHHDVFGHNRHHERDITGEFDPLFLFHGRRRRIITVTTPTLLHWVREGYREWIVPETWLLKTRIYGGDVIAKLVKDRGQNKLWGCFFADGLINSRAWETNLLGAQVKACEFLESKHPGVYQWPIGEAREVNAQKRW